MTVPPSPNASARPENRERKAALRTEFRQRRRALSGAERGRLDAGIREQLLSAVAATGARRIGAFAAFDGEPDLLPLLPVLEEQGLVLALPVLAGRDGSGRGLRFHRWTAAAPMESNAFGIREPRGTRAVAVRDLDLLLMPLVAWTRAGARLGMGAGYYDRALAGADGDSSPLRLGVAYAVQEAPALPVDPWDERLHAVVTEDGWIECRPPPAPGRG